MREHPAFAHLEAALSATSSARAANVMLRVDADDARLALMHVATKHQQPTSALFGWTLTVKDLFDVAGQVTGAGSPSRANCPPAEHDAPAVAKLKAAGAVVVGRTNMTEFAFSGVGINPPLAPLSTQPTHKRQEYPVAHQAAQPCQLVWELLISVWAQIRVAPCAYPQHCAGWWALKARRAWCRWLVPTPCPAAWIQWALLQQQSIKLLPFTKC